MYISCFCFSHEEYEAELDSNDPAILRRLLKEYRKENQDVHAAMAGMRLHAVCRVDEVTQGRLDLEEMRKAELVLKSEIIKWKGNLQKVTDELFEAQNVLIPDLERQKNRLQRQADLRALLLKEERRQSSVDQSSVAARLDQATLQSQGLAVELRKVKKIHSREMQDVQSQVEKLQAAISGVKELATANGHVKIVGFLKMNGY